MKTKLSILIIPPVVASLVVGICTGAIGYSQMGGVDSFLLWGAVGALIGFLWGSLVWTEKIINSQRPVIQPPREYSNTSPFRVEVRQEDPAGYLHVDWIDLPREITLEKLCQAAQVLEKNGWEFSHATLAGRHKIFSRSEYEILREYLLMKRFVRKKNPHARQQGFELTPVGKGLFKKLLTYQEPFIANVKEMLGGYKHTHGHKE